MSRREELPAPEITSGGIEEKPNGQMKLISAYRFFESYINQAQEDSDFHQILT